MIVLQHKLCISRGQCDFRIDLFFSFSFVIIF